MMRRLFFIAFLLVAQAAPALAQEFHVVASRRAIVRDEPSTAAEPLATFERGDAAPCIVAGGQPVRDDEADFYLIQLPGTGQGWISRFTVRLHDGPVPGMPAPASSAAKDTPAWHLAIGAPRGYVQLENAGYIVGYDPRLKQPAWVQYRIDRADILTAVDRGDAFTADTRLHTAAQATDADYEAARSWNLWLSLGMMPPPPPNQPNYARGHLAPSRDLSRTVDIRTSSDLLSNMSPQVHGGYNNGVWSALERRVRTWVEARGELTIIAGPVFLSSPRQLTPAIDEAQRRQDLSRAVVLAQPPTERQVIYNIVGPAQVAVPTAFFKIIVDHRDPENPEVLAFLIPHYSQETDDLSTRLVSVREIEQLTGLDLLSGFSEQVQERVETAAAPAIW